MTDPLWLVVVGLLLTSGPIIGIIIKMCWDVESERIERERKAEAESR